MLDCYFVRLCSRISYTDELVYRMRRVNLFSNSCTSNKLYYYKIKSSQYLVYKCNNPSIVLGLRKNKKHIIVLQEILINNKNTITN